uniref:Transmembrane protein family 132 middle domain-containing protein n=1 Tax=Neolamprologus brichardi TaxID=32507 RepID=A0A3Q4GW27_NEOBR
SPQPFFLLTVTKVLLIGGHMVVGFFSVCIIVGSTLLSRAGMDSSADKEAKIQFLLLIHNTSPFAFSQSMFVLPPTGWATKPGLRASFGPHSVTQVSRREKMIRDGDVTENPHRFICIFFHPQLLSESVLPASPPLSASLLSESVEIERDKGGRERFRVRVLFHKRGNISSDLRTCITLLAFKETEEHKASCITQPPLGLCVVTLTLPSSWYSHPLVNQSHPWYSNTRHTHQWMQKRKWQRSIRRHGNHQQNICAALCSCPQLLSIATLCVFRMKVKKGLVSIVAQRTLTSDMWTVTLERTQASKHDVPTLLQQVACLSVDGLRRSFGVAMMVPANWWVEYSRRTTMPITCHLIALKVCFLLVCPQSNTLINTAILNNQPVLLPVIVLAVSHDEKVSDVTSAVTCHSINENSIKVSSDCSTLYVDGSESGLGSTCAVVEFHLGMLSGSVCLEVWAPSVPLRVSLADPTLNVIDGWDLITEEGWEETSLTPRVFFLLRCVPVYQRSSVQVLTQFTAQDSHSRTTHHLGSSDWFVDVTELVSNWLRVEDPRVASLRPQNIVIGLRPGKTSLLSRSSGMACWAPVTSLCPLTLSALAICLYNPINALFSLQEASVSVWLQFSDDTASLLSSFSDLPFSLRLSSLAESVIMVTPTSNQRVFAQGDGGGPLLRLIVSNSFDEETEERQASMRREGTRRLARGSGWIRVNLDLDFMQPVATKSEDGEEFEFDISDTLVESHGDIYSSNKDESWNVSTSSNYHVSQTVTNRRWNEVDKGGMVSRNTLERAVLMPSLDEGKVYFFPSQDKGGAEEDKQGTHELELGVGAVLSLLCLFAVLFLANCLPSTLRHRSRRTKERMEGGLEAGATEDGEEMEREKAKDLLKISVFSDPKGCFQKSQWTCGRSLKGR